MTIQLFTDFGASGLYVGQVRLALHAGAPGVPVIDLLNDAPAFGIEPAAHLLAALLPHTSPGSVTLAVVDPGVGGPRGTVVVAADRRWLVGPDNGLLSVAAARAAARTHWRIVWRPQNAAASFHGRDLFAPIAAAIAKGEFPAGRLASVDGLAVNLPLVDLAQVIYADHYGNLVTGLRASGLGPAATLRVCGRTLPRARVFSDVAPATLFWYANSLGLVEIAANQDDAARRLGAGVGTAVAVSS